MKIKIKDTEYELKYTIRALFVFEELTGRMFELKTLTDYYIFLYSLVIASNPNLQLTFNELIDELDENPQFMNGFKQFLDKEYEKQNQFVTKEVDGKKKS